MEKRSDRYKVSKLKIFLIIILIIFILIGSIIVWSRFVSTSGLDVKETKIVNSKLPESFKGFKIIHISDIHYGKTINKSKLSKVVDKINLINPDLVVFTGDLIDKDTDINDKVIIGKTISYDNPDIRISFTNKYNYEVSIIPTYNNQNKVIFKTTYKHK